MRSIRPKYISRAMQLAVLGVAMGASACSIGEIQDDVTGAGIGHATVTFEKWNVDNALVYVNDAGIPPGYAPALSFNNASKTWDNADPGAQNRQGVWYLNPYAALNPGDTTNTYVEEGWNRVTISHPGYETRYVYRNHLYVHGGIYTSSPYSAGPYPASTDTKQNDSSTLYSIASYRLHPTTQVTRHRAPDIVVDPRTLLDCEISDTHGSAPVSLVTPTHDCEGALNPDTGLPVQRCLRYSVGTANVGEGDLWVKGTAGSPDVNQFVYTQPYPDKDTVAAVAMPPSSIVYHPEHNHFHFKDWTRTRLRAMTAACNREALASQCPSIWKNDSYKTSFCLEDYRTTASNLAASTFDGHYQARRGFYDSPTYTSCGYEQGIGAGRMDTYRRVVPEQMIDITGLAPGSYWLEVEVNPDPAVEESDYTNNISRVLIDIPAVGSDAHKWQCKKCSPVAGGWSCTNASGTTAE